MATIAAVFGSIGLACVITGIILIATSSTLSPAAIAVFAALAFATGLTALICGVKSVRSHDGNRQLARYGMIAGIVALGCSVVGGLLALLIAALEALTF